MIAARASRRVAARNLRAVRVNAPRTRFQSTAQKVVDKATPESTAGKGFSAGLAGGLTGGAIVFLVSFPPGGSRTQLIICSLDTDTTTPRAQRPSTIPLLQQRRSTHKLNQQLHKTHQSRMKHFSG